jgi:hypothetical protein
MAAKDPSNVHDSVRNACCWVTPGCTHASSQAVSSPDNTVIRLQDSLLLFETEFQQRWLGHFLADGPLPVPSIFDHGFYVQSSYDIKPKNLEPYVSTSWLFGDKRVGFGTSKELIGGINIFSADTRNVRVNLQVIGVNRSPVSSVFGYDTGGLKGPIVSAEVSVLF